MYEICDFGMVGGEPCAIKSSPNHRTNLRKYLLGIVAPIVNDNFGNTIRIICFYLNFFVLFSMSKTKLRRTIQKMSQKEEQYNSLRKYFKMFRENFTSQNMNVDMLFYLFKY